MPRRICLRNRQYPRRNPRTVRVSGICDKDLDRRVQQQDVVDCVTANTADSINRRTWLVQRLKRDRHMGALIVDDSPSSGGYAAALPGM